MPREAPGVGDGPEQLAQGLEKVRYGRRLTEDAARNTKTQVATGERLAAISSDAQDGWCWCQRHGWVHSVNQKTGKWSRSGICEACWKGTYSEQAKADRIRETEAEAERERQRVVDAADDLMEEAGAELA